MICRIEHETAFKILDALRIARDRGWTPAVTHRWRSLAAAPDLVPYLHHHSRRGERVWGAARFLEEVRALARRSLPEGAYLQPWLPLLDCDLDLARTRHERLASHLEADDAVARVAELLPDDVEGPWRVLLLPDGQSSGYRHHTDVVIDILPVWLGEVEADAIASRVSSALFRAVMDQRWEVWRTLYFGSMRTLGEQWAAELLARLVHAGVAMRCLRQAPSGLDAAERRQWERAAANVDDPMLELADRLATAMRGDTSASSVKADDALLSAGYFSRYQVLGSALVTLLLEENGRSTKEALADPRLLPGLLLEHGMSPEIAAWCMGLGEGGWIARGRPELKPVQPRGIPATWSVVAEDESFAAVSLGVNAGSTADPPNREGLAHLVEHALVARLSERAGGRLLARGTTEKEATLFTFPLERSSAECWPDLLAAMFEPLDLTNDSLTAFKREVQPEVDEFARHPAAMLQAELERQMFETPFGRSLVGTQTSVDAISTEDVRAFHARHYRPSGLVVATVGCSLPEGRSFVDPGDGPSAGPARARRLSGAIEPIRANLRESGHWAMALPLEGKQSAHRFTLGALRHLWTTTLQQDFGDAVRCDLTLYVGGGYGHFYVDPSATITGEQLLHALRAAASVSDPVLEAAIAEERQLYDAIADDPELLSLWLAGQGLFFEDRSADVLEAARCVASVSADELRNLARRVASTATRGTGGLPAVATITK